MSNSAILIVQENFKNQNISLVLACSFTIVITCLAFSRKMMCNLNVFGTTLEQWPLANTIQLVLLLFKITNGVKTSVDWFIE